MARPIWTGTISFGLVNIPVKLITAVKSTEIRFHQLHEKDGVRLRQRLICPADDEEVARDDIVKGYEIAPDQYVIVNPDELDALAPESSKALDITDFVDLDSIDPIYYDRPYYLLPGENAAKPYSLLVQAMEKAKKVGIAKFVMRQKEYLAALRPVEGAICLEIMHFAGEVIPAKKLEGVPEKAKVDERQLKVANQLIEALAGDFEPEKYRDEYRDKVEHMLEEKAKGHEVVTPPQVETKPTKAVDLLAALEESLKTAREKQGAPA
jgi:DNA end-binding protein Ku